MEPDLEKQLAQLLNRFSQENASNTPDFILAQYMLDCLKAFEVAARARDAWHVSEVMKRPVEAPR